MSSDTSSRRAVLGRRIRGAALGVWAIVLSTVISSLMVGHWVSLPHPDLGDETMQRAMDHLRQSAQHRSWTVVHFLGADCRCSARVADDLLGRLPTEGVDHHIVLIGEDEDLARRARARAIGLDSLSSDRASAEWNVQAAPLLLIADASGGLRYVGGYTDRKQSLAVQTDDILERLQRGDSVDPLPVLGCGTTSTLRETLDPWGLRDA